MASSVFAMDITFQGSMVALVTPMQSDGKLDYAAYQELINWHIAEKTDALAVVGTTGESPSVSMEEHAELIRRAVLHAAGHIPVIAGVGANSTQEAIELTECARKFGAHAGLSVVPYYNKPSQEGLYWHFRKISEAVDLPLILYNVPGRTVADLSLDTVLRLAQIPGIIGIKDATGDIGRGLRLLREAPPGFQVFSGDDATAAALMLFGARGTISVAANVVPRKMHDLCAAALAGEAATVIKINHQLIPLYHALSVEANPIPVKWALARMGKIAVAADHPLAAAYRLPLVSLSAQHHATVEAALRDEGLLKKKSSR